MTDNVLAIASVESYVDLRNAKTGQRINLLRFENPAVCQTIQFSPDGQYLAVGLSDGDVLVFPAGLQLGFHEPPICVSHSSRVNSVAFSPDSLLMTVATQDSILRAYRLSNLSDGYFEQFIEPSVYGRKSKPADIADHALYPHKYHSLNFSISDSHSLFLISKKKEAYPVIITKITSPRDDQRGYGLVNARLEDEDYRVACYQKSNMLAAAIITCSGELLLTYLTPSASSVWAVTYHTERLDVNLDKDYGFCSLRFTDTRVLAVDRRGNLLIMELILT